MKQQLRAFSPRAGGLAVGAVALVSAVLVGGWLLGTHVRYLGTNSVAPRFPLPALPAGQRLCVRRLMLPKDANALRLAVAAGSQPVPVTLRLEAGGRVQTATAQAQPGRYGAVFHISPFDRFTPATACITAPRTLPSGAGMPLGGSGEGNAYIDGKIVGRMTVAYLHYPSRSLLSALPAGARRASLFRAGFVGAWTYWLLALVVLGAWVAGLRVMLRSIP